MVVNRASGASSFDQQETVVGQPYVLTTLEYPGIVLQDAGGRHCGGSETHVEGAGG